MRRTEQDQDAEAEAPLEVLAALGDALLATTLVASGYHRHDRGAWRKSAVPERHGTGSATSRRRRRA